MSGSSSPAGGLRTVFFGTPEFAVPTLAAMVEAGFAPLWVVSQPARPVGRKRVLTQPPVAAWAEAHGFELVQPEKVNRRDFLERIEAAEVDVAVVVAFGQIFRKRLLAAPRHGCLNLHASLLPKYRGAAPIQAAVAAGDEVTGATVMRMEAGLDSGPMLRTVELAIGPDETAVELSPRLAEAGAQALVETLRELAKGPLPGTPQQHDLATFAPRLTKDDAQVDWGLEARRIYDRWRAHTPWPGLASGWRGRAVKLLKVEVISDVATGCRAGEVLGLSQQGLEVACGSGTILRVERLQLAGKQAIAAADFVNGERPAPGEAFAPLDDGV